MYDYKARIIRWIDGDTVVVNIDQGFGNWTVQHIRLIGLYCPKGDAPGGPEATARAEQLCPPGDLVFCDTRKAPEPIPVQNGRSFTRYLGTVTPLATPGVSVQRTLIHEGLGSPTP
jgi:micrococcal nuclease